MDSSTIDTLRRLADQFVAARQMHCRIATTDLSGEPRDAAQAYRVQDDVARALRWFEQAPPQVWKSGAPNRDVEPIAAPVPESLVHASPASLPASRFHSIRIEAEIALRFSAPVELARIGDPGYAWGEVIGEALVGIEIVDTRLADPNASALLKLADFHQQGVA